MCVKCASAAAGHCSRTSGARGRGGSRGRRRPRPARARAPRGPRRRRRVDGDVTLVPRAAEVVARAAQVLPEAVLEKPEHRVGDDVVEEVVRRRVVRDEPQPVAGAVGGVCSRPRRRRPRSSGEIALAIQVTSWCETSGASAVTRPPAPRRATCLPSSRAYDDRTAVRDDDELASPVAPQSLTRHHGSRSRRRLDAKRAVEELHEARRDPRPSGAAADLDLVAIERMIAIPRPPSVSSASFALSAASARSRSRRPRPRRSAGRRAARRRCRPAVAVRRTRAGPSRARLGERELQVREGASGVREHARGRRGRAATG